MSDAGPVLVQLLDARRLTGPSLYCRVPAVLLELAVEPNLDNRARVLDAVLVQLERILTRAGLAVPGPEALWTRPFQGGLAIAFEGPIDTLLAATECAEWAVTSSAEVLAGRAELPLDPHGAAMAEMVAAERSPLLLALQAETTSRELPFLWDDERVTIGAGAGSATWPRDALPTVRAVPWERLRTVPTALITGTNGKTTSARLVARMVREAGLRAGCTSTDGISVNEMVVETGDCTGPFAARTVLSRPDVDVAVLETARGGILRRGLAVQHCDVALITNVSDDHLGTYGIDDVPAMVRVKAVVGHAVRSSGKVVLNADDPRLVALAPEFAAEIVFFSLDPQNESTRTHRESGGETWFERDGVLVRSRGGIETALLEARDIPITFGGAARFNVRNALGAGATASALGVPDDAIVRALRSFKPSPEDNPGRGNVMNVRGVKVLLDFAHNAEGIRAVLELASAGRGSGRLTVITGHPGDRTDEALRGVAAIIHAGRPDRVLIRELEDHRRGRAIGEVPEIIRKALVALGMRDEHIVVVASEVAALQAVLADAEAGDVVLLLAHLDRDAVRDYLATRG